MQCRCSEHFGKSSALNQSNDPIHFGSRLGSYPASTGFLKVYTKGLEAGRYLTYIHWNEPISVVL
jgi:hypothetical protein